MVGAKEAQITSFYPYPSIGPEVVNINRFVGLTLRRADVTGQLIKFELFKIIHATRKTNPAHESIISSLITGERKGSIFMVIDVLVRQTQKSDGGELQRRI